MNTRLRLSNCDKIGKDYDVSTFKDICSKGIISCPVCKAEMDVEENKTRVLYCKGVKKHSYDFSSVGYVNLSRPGQSNGGDCKAAVRARSAFLDTEYYRPIADKLCQLVKKYCAKDGIVVDAGCGEGYYSTAIADNGFFTLGFDLSKFATEAAAKRARIKGLSNTFFGVASVFDIPLTDRSAGLLVNIFAPCVENEYVRVIEDDGAVIVVYAGPEHLKGLKSAVYNNVYTNEERADLPKSMQMIESERLTYNIVVKGNKAVKDLFAMTPYYWKTSLKDVNKLEGMEELATEIDIVFAVYKKIN